MVVVSSDFIQRRFVEISTCLNSLSQHSFVLLLCFIDKIVIKISFTASPFIDLRSSIRWILWLWKCFCPNRNFKFKEFRANASSTRVLKMFCSGCSWSELMWCSWRWFKSIESLFRVVSSLRIYKSSIIRI